ncbi:CoB--CoM heterodisulfide reductase iron-sulfur subunit A family protein [Hugonella massiliensis]|uniref:CoB--CoM heterodisulfide reductase iron-sulfur subunit A family protein n=1 Tax=Hugonella massiliensis TaxID=1720315 RepID=UPI00073ED675|nr:CoB--CoM heterodisulfide reductase iron-sulfur subunit A family protein [Hugonella massiliensis]MDD6730055.1 CoB--CoM heterodisulfide reductase iron-sulfur subunit A family protein [Eggerthellaceae bacterium]
MSRIGVFVCHCGTNIAGTVDVEAVAEAARQMPNVVYAGTNKYMCSAQGQDYIVDLVKEHNLDRVVIASCSPRMHERLFRKVLAEKTDLNPYLLEVANIREQCSWVHKDKQIGTPKAISLVAMAVAKADCDTQLFTHEIPVTKRALIIGGGIAGIQAALDIADAGFPVTIVERKTTIGGKMPMLDKTFPTLDCSACISTPKMSECEAHPLIEIKTLSEVEKVEGYIGNFDVTIREKAKYIDYDACTGCGMCETKCPQKKIPSEFNQGMSMRTAIYKPFPQAVPNKPTIDAAHCRMLTEGKCGVCAKVCPTGAINYQDVDRVTTERYGAIVLATGYDLIDWTKLYGEYGGGRYADVISGLQFERLVNASGPTEGHILRPSDGTEPKTMVIVKCVGSRDPHKGVPYCSRACCMYGAKHAHQFMDKIPGGKCFVFYMDVRTPGKNYDEFYMNTLHEGAHYIRGRISKITRRSDGKLVCLGEDTLSGNVVEVDADLVVLETAMVPPEGEKKLAQAVNTQLGPEGFFSEAHPKLRPVETNTGGLYLAGTAQGPKDIPDTVAQAGAAAAKVIGLLCKQSIESNPMVAHVDDAKCSGCGACVDICPYSAVTLVEKTLRENSRKVTRTVAQVNEGLCQGCGACTVACRPGASDLLGFNDEGIMREVEAYAMR